MTKTKDLLLAGTILPALLAGAPGLGRAQTPAEPIVLAQAFDPNNPRPGQRPPQGQQPQRQAPPQQAAPPRMAPPQQAAPPRMAPPQQAAPQRQAPIAQPIPPRAPAGSGFVQPRQPQGGGQPAQRQMPPQQAFPQRQAPPPIRQAQPPQAPAIRQVAPIRQAPSVQQVTPSRQALPPVQQVAPNRQVPPVGAGGMQPGVPRQGGPANVPPQGQPSLGQPNQQGQGGRPAFGQPNTPGQPPIPQGGGRPVVGQPGQPGGAPQGSVPPIPGQPGQIQRQPGIGQPNLPSGTPGAPGQIGRPAGVPGQPNVPGQVGQPPIPGQAGQPPIPGQVGQPPIPGQRLPGQPNVPGQAGQPPIPGQAGQPPIPGQPGQFGQRPPGQPGQPGLPPQPGQPGFQQQPGFAGPPGGMPPAPPQRTGPRISPAAALAIGGAAGLVGGFIAADGLRRYDDVRQRRQEFSRDGVMVIQEPGRTIVRDDNGAYVRYDENARFRDLGGPMRSERLGDEVMTIYDRPGGVRVITVTDQYGQLVRRVRRYPDGREVILIDNSFRGPPSAYSEVVILPPPQMEMPQKSYIVDAGESDQRGIYEALSAPPVARIPRRYTLDEVRRSPSLRAYTRSVDVNTINFATGSWEISPDQSRRLATLAQAMGQAIQANPNEVFLIEGHTDAVGNDTDNMSLSDRRAQSVAEVLTRDFNIPPENLTTQGYGSQYPRVQTAGASVENRRVTARRITDLLAQQQQQQQGQAPAPAQPRQ